MSPRHPAIKMLKTAEKKIKASREKCCYIRNRETTENVKEEKSIVFTHFFLLFIVIPFWCSKIPSFVISCLFKEIHFLGVDNIGDKIFFFHLKMSWFPLKNFFMYINLGSQHLKIYHFIYLSSHSFCAILIWKLKSLVVCIFSLLT